nr:hypothetical protein [Candidatus Sigynarchaeota archaeon]
MNDGRLELVLGGTRDGHAWIWNFYRSALVWTIYSGHFSWYLGIILGLHLFRISATNYPLILVI